MLNLSGCGLVNERVREARAPACVNGIGFACEKQCHVCASGEGEVTQVERSRTRLKVDLARS